MSHLASLWTYVLHPLIGRGYQWWSGLGSDLSELTLLGLALGAFRHLNCHGRWWCPFIARHPTADGQHKLCGLHHPDIARRHLSLPEIHERHHHAKERKP